MIVSVHPLFNHCVSRAMRERLFQHDGYIRQHGEDMPEIRNWNWPTVASRPGSGKL